MLLMNQGVFEFLFRLKFLIVNKKKLVFFIDFEGEMMISVVLIFL